MDTSVLKEATSGDDTPTPGFILSDIARATVASYQSCTQLQDFLRDRLTKQNPNIRLKCLVIIKHVCRHGRPEFKRDMAKNTDSIKDCLQYKCATDPLKGDEPSKRVREAAKDAMDAIFDSQAPVITSSVAAANRIQGFGGGDSATNSNPQSSKSSILGSFKSSLYSGGGNDGDFKYASHPGASGTFTSPSPASPNDYPNNFSNNGTYNNPGTYNGPTNGGSKMEGFGNPNFPVNNEAEKPSWLKSAASLVTESFPGTISAMNTMGSQSNLNQGFAQNNPPPYQGNAIRSNASVNVYGQPVNNAPWSSSTASNGSSNGNRSIPATNTMERGGNSDFESGSIGAIVPDIPMLANGLGRAGLAATDGTYEKQMLESLCEPGGLKNTPNEEKLRQFLTTAPTLNVEIVASCLIDLLNHDAWQARVKALIVIANLGQNKQCTMHAQFWQSNHEDIQGLLRDSKSSVRSQAIKTLKVLKVDVSETDKTVATHEEHNSKQHSQQQHHQHQNGSFSLLDMDNELVSPTLPPVPSLPAQVAFASPAVPVFGSQGTSNMFEGLSLSSATTPAISSVAHTPSSVPPPVPAASSFDLLNSLEPTPAPVLANAPPSFAAEATAPIPSSTFSTATATAPATTGKYDLSFLSNPPPIQQPMPMSMYPSQPGFGGHPGLVPGLSVQPRGAYNPQYPVPYGNMPPGYGAPHPYQQQQQQQQAGYRPGVVSNVMPVYNPSIMSSPNSTKKVIPDVNAPSGSSSFSFMAGPAKPSNDSFSFIADEVKSSASKK